MIDVGNKVNMFYTPYGSGAIPSTNAFSYYGINCSSQTYSEEAVFYSLKNGLPVMMIADTSTQPADRHAWVADGYRETRKTYDVEYIWHHVYTDDPGLDIEAFYTDDEMALIDPYMYDGKTEYDQVVLFTDRYLLMNWGADGVNLMYNDVFYSPYLSSSWVYQGCNFNTNKWIISNFQ